MKNEIYLQLLPIERQLLSAIKSNYARLSAKEFEAFCNTYKEAYGVELTKSERNCNACRLRVLKKVGTDYFQYQEWYKGRWGRKPEEPKEETISQEISNPNPVEPQVENADSSVANEDNTKEGEENV